MQQRAPLFKGKRDQFARLLIDFIKTEKFHETICLTSSHAYERMDIQITGTQCRYISTSSNQINNWLELEERNQDKSFIPGGGIAQKFFKLSKELNLNTTILIIFASEGNNIPEAFQLVNYLNEWKKYLKIVILDFDFDLELI
jgi:proteasome assembly chaperone 2